MAFEKYTPSPLERVGLSESTFKKVTKHHPLPWKVEGTGLVDSFGNTILEIYQLYTPTGKTNQRLYDSIIEVIVKAVNNLNR